MLITKKNKGFTLIELIITVAILAIIAAIAFPAYERYKRKGYRMDAINYLIAAASHEESWLADNNLYTSDLGKLGGTLTENDHFTVSAVSSGATSFTITAITKGAQLKDTDCATYTIDNVGRRKAKKADNTDNSRICWGN